MDRRPGLPGSKGSRILYGRAPGLEPLASHAGKSRRQGASIFIYLIFGLLIVIFVINFNPGAGGGQTAAVRGRTTPSFASTVRSDAERLSRRVLESVQPRHGKQHTHVALEMLIRRELLAQEAERAACRHDRPGPRRDQEGPLLPRRPEDANPRHLRRGWHLAHQAFQNWIGQLNISRNSYISEQARSMLASMMAKILSSRCRSRATRRSSTSCSRATRSCTTSSRSARELRKGDEAHRRRRRSLHLDAQRGSRSALQGRRAHVEGREAAAQAPPDLHREAEEPKPQKARRSDGKR